MIEKLLPHGVVAVETFEDVPGQPSFPGEESLIVNAVDAMPEGGRLRVRVSKSHQSNGRRRDGVRVTLADTGMGISEHGRAHLFEPFYTTKKDSGTGLGLWLSEGIVRKHDGSIQVRTSTRPGHSGTVFSLFLPSNS